MRQLIYDCNGYATFWARTRPGHHRSLYRALERALDHCEGQGLIFQPLHDTFHALSNDLHDPPITYRQWLDWVEPPFPDSDLKSSISDDDLIYETCIMTNSRVEKLSLPRGVLFMGTRLNVATEKDKRIFAHLGRSQAFSDPEDEPYF